jgi:hypothetical protein
MGIYKTRNQRSFCTILTWHIGYRSWPSTTSCAFFFLL